MAVFLFKGPCKYHGSVGTKPRPGISWQTTNSSLKGMSPFGHTSRLSSPMKSRVSSGCLGFGAPAQTSRLKARRDLKDPSNLLRLVESSRKLLFPTETSLKTKALIPRIAQNVTFRRKTWEGPAPRPASKFSSPVWVSTFLDPLSSCDVYDSMAKHRGGSVLVEPSRDNVE